MERRQTARGHPGSRAGRDHAAVRRLIDDEHLRLEHQQLGHVRARLVADGACAGLTEQTVDEAVRRAHERFAHASVHGFVPILVERAVREQLRIPAMRQGNRGRDIT